MLIFHIQRDGGPWWNKTFIFWCRFFCDGLWFTGRKMVLKGLQEGTKWKARGKKGDLIANKLVLIMHLEPPWQCVIHFLALPSSLDNSFLLFSTWGQHHCPPAVPGCKLRVLRSCLFLLWSIWSLTLTLRLFLILFLILSKIVVLIPYSKRVKYVFLL